MSADVGGIDGLGLDSLGLDFRRCCPGCHGLGRGRRCSGLGLGLGFGLHAAFSPPVIFLRSTARCCLGLGHGCRRLGLGRVFWRLGACLACHGRGPRRGRGLVLGLGRLVGRCRGHGTGRGLGLLG